jgi:oligogalacturonide transport system substrate-binding protein
MLKKAVALILGVTMAASLAGCGAKVQQETAAQEKAPQATAAQETTTQEQKAVSEGAVTDDKTPVNLRFSWWGGEARHNATMAAVDEFQKDYPWITVECEYSSWDGWTDKVATQLAGNTAPDLMQVNWNWLYQFSSDGSKFVDLNQYKDIISLENWKEENLQAMTVGGKLQGVPISITGKLPMYNKTTFDKAGVPVPTTFEELRAAGKAFKEKLGDDYYPLAEEGYERMIWMVFYLQQKHGREWMKDLQVNYTVEEVKEGMEWINSLEEDHVLPKIAVIEGDGAENFLSNKKWMDGHYAGITEYDSNVQEIADSLDEGQELVLGQYPTDLGSNPAGMSKVSSGFAITETSEHKEEAALLLEYITSNEKGVKLMGTERGTVCNTVAKKILEDADILDGYTLEGNQIVLNFCKYTFDPNFENAALKERTGVYYEVFDNLSAGADPAEMAQYLIDSINEVNAANPY